MPFKGDMRLGGPHDNEASLNGTSDGPSVPPINTFLRTDRVSYPVEEGGQEVSYYADGMTYYAPSQTVEVDIYADGLGGEVTDWNNERNPEYKASGTPIYEDTSPSGSGSNVAWTPVGDFTIESWSGTRYIHDGYGGSGTEYIGYFWAGTATEGSPAYIGSDTNGGVLETEVPSGSSSYYTWATYTSIDYYWDFNGSYYYESRQGVSQTVNQYDYITTYDGVDYYWGEGGNYDTASGPPEY